MQKTLTKVPACRNPSVRQAGCVPVSVMVLGKPWPKAPEVRCRHLVLGVVVHWLSAVQGCGGFWKEGVNGWPQQPQKPKFWAARSWGIFVCDPVQSANGVGRRPRHALDVGR